MEAGYWHAYRSFYRWGSIFKAASTKQSVAGRLCHLAYTGGWKKFEPLWDLIIRAKRVASFLPVLEAVLDSHGHRPSDRMAQDATLSGPTVKGAEQPSLPPQPSWTDG